MNVFGVIWAIIILIGGLTLVLPYLIPYARRVYRKPKPVTHTPVLALDPNMFKLKRQAIKQEHKVWADEFKLYGDRRSWNYKPREDTKEIWDEDADETLLMIECKNHPRTQTCYYCDNNTHRYAPKRQRRKR